jgi:DNA-binding NarL/FixJ family response regulator
MERDDVIKVLLVDDNALFRDGIAQILHADGRFQVVGQASNGIEAVAAAGRLHPDLILMDLRMPGMGGVEAIRAIRADAAEVPIGVLTMFESRQYVQSALEAGASGYVAKDATPADFCEAASLLAHGKRELVAIPNDPAAGPESGAPSHLLARLTVRELEVLRALSTDASTAEIARELGITTKTLQNHISNTYRKLGIYDRAQAVILAVREGLVDVPSP